MSGVTIAYGQALQVKTSSLTVAEESQQYLTSEVTALQNCINQLQIKNNDLIDSQGMLQAENGKLVEGKAAIQYLYNQNNQKLMHFVEDTKHNLSLIENLKIQLDESITQQQRIAGELTNSQQLLNEVTQDLVSARAGNGDLTNDIVLLRQTITALTTEKDQLSDQVQTLTSHSIMWRESQAELTRQIEKLTAQHVELQQALAAAKEKARHEMQLRIKKLDETHAVDVHQQQKTLHKALSTNASMQQHNEGLEKKLNQRDETIASLQAELDGCHQEIEELQIARRQPANPSIGSSHAASVNCLFNGHSKSKKLASGLDTPMATRLTIQG